MRPFIEGDRDSVLLSRLTRDPRVGDIVLAQTTTLCGKTSYVLHRLIRIESSNYILQGDGNLSGEEICARGNILAFVTRIESPSGRRKPLTRARLWYHLRPFRGFLLKIYRHTILKLYKQD